MLPVAQAVVIEWDVLVVGQQVKPQGVELADDPFDLVIAAATITFVPDLGRERVGVADDQWTVKMPASNAGRLNLGLGITLAPATIVSIESPILIY